MLVPETIEILGGLVEELDAARNRLVGELKKPPRPRGRRYKSLQWIAVCYLNVKAVSVQTFLFFLAGLFYCKIAICDFTAYR